MGATELRITGLTCSQGRPEQKSPTRSPGTVFSADLSTGARILFDYCSRFGSAPPTGSVQSSMQDLKPMTERRGERPPGITRAPVLCERPLVLRPLVSCWA